MAKNNTLVSNFLQTTGKTFAANGQRRDKPTHLHALALKTPKTRQRHTSAGGTLRSAHDDSEVL